MFKNKRKIILCYPRLNRYDRERPYHWFPFSVLPLAHMLKDHGYNPEVLDFRVDKTSYQKLRNIARDVLAVGISVMSGYQIRGGLRIARLIRRLNPKIPLIWGGWHPTILPQETAEHPLVDIAISGKGEEILVNVLDALRNNKRIDSEKGIAFKNGRQVIFTGYKTYTCVKDDAQLYERFIDIQSYVNSQTRAFGYFTGHGCVFKCAFCSRHYMLKGYSPLPFSKILDDINYFVYRHGFRRIHFQDDNFFIDRKRVLKIAKNLVGKDITWWANVRANVIPMLNKEEIEILVASGMNTLFIGVESASQHLLGIMNKGTRTDDIIKTNEIMKRYNVNLHLSYMFGVPGDTLDDLRQNIEQIKLLKRQNKNIKVQTCFYQPYPGSALYKKAIESGYPRRVGLESWSRLKPQTAFIKVPWLDKKEMRQYKKEFTSFFTAN